MPHPRENDCGNRHIDGLALRGRLASVWDRLEHLFPMVKAHGYEVWLARRSGAVRRLVEGDQRFTVLVEHQTIGPQGDAEWQLLAFAALEAIGKPPADASELDRRDGLWTGMDPHDAALVKRHQGCAWCSQGWIPCPTTSYPMAHVGGPR